MASSTAPLPANRFPRLPLYSAIGLVAFAIAAVMFGQATEIGTLRNPSTSPESIRDLSFVELEGDRIRVLDARSGSELALIGPDQDGFIRGFLRGLGHQRKLHNVEPDQAYRLILWNDGSLTISDTATGQRVMLNAFGATNAAALARFLEKRSATP
ncbi:photosynthetic complex assembly protein PuhC [Alsobacter sp. R-9]